MICVARNVTVVVLNTSLKKEWKWLKIVLYPIGSESEITAKKFTNTEAD